MSSTYAGDPDNYPTEITIPSGGDLVAAASVNAALEGLADRTAALSKLRLVDVVVSKSDDAASAHNATTTATPTGSFANVTKLLDLTDLEVGDVVEISCAFYAQTSATGGVYLRLGHSTTFLAINCDIPEQSVDEWEGTPRRVAIHGYYTVTTAGDQPVYLQVRGEPLTLQIKTPQVAIAKVYRRSP